MEKSRARGKYHGLSLYTLIFLVLGVVLLLITTPILFTLIKSFMGLPTAASIVVVLWIVYGFLLYSSTEKNSIINLIYTILSLFFFLLFLITAMQILNSLHLETYNGLITIDYSISQYFYNNYSLFLGNIFVFISYLFSPQLIIILTSFLIIYLIRIGERWRSFILFFSIFTTLLIGALLKYIFQRPRPQHAVILLRDYSFPSGHVLSIVVFLIILLYLFSSILMRSSIARLLSVSFSIIILLLTILSRLYLNVHWFSDIIASLFLGLFWSLFIMVFFDLYTSNEFLD